MEDILDLLCDNDWFNGITASSDLRYSQLKRMLYVNTRLCVCLQTLTLFC